MATAAQPSSAGRHRPGLRKLSADQIGKAINETEKQVNSIMLAFIGAAAFCVLSLLTPDSALLGGSDEVTVPLAGPVSFIGFIIIGPAVLVVLRVYLQIYIEHGKRLARIARLVAAKRDPILLSSQNGFLRIAFALALFLLLPLTLLMFARKAAVFPAWGAGLLCVAAAVIAGHAMLPLHRFSWRSRALLSLSVAILAGGAMLGLGSPRRSFALLRANLSDQELAGDDLSGADLSFANLSGADLAGADLRGAVLIIAKLSGAWLGQAKLNGANLGLANLSGADLNGADLSGAQLNAADLTGAYLMGASLSRANLRSADLRDANLFDAQLIGADLSGARNLTQAQLDNACGTGVQLPPGLTLKPCPEPAAPPAPAPARPLRFRPVPTSCSAVSLQTIGAIGTPRPADNTFLFSWGRWKSGSAMAPRAVLDRVMWSSLTTSRARATRRARWEFRVSVPLCRWAPNCPAPIRV